MCECEKKKQMAVNLYITAKWVFYLILQKLRIIQNIVHLQVNGLAHRLYFETA